MTRNALAEKFKNARITKQVSSDDLQQSSSTKQILQNVSIQLKASKASDWVIGMPSFKT